MIGYGIDGREQGRDEEETAGYQTKATAGAAADHREGRAFQMEKIGTQQFRFQIDKEPSFPALILWNLCGLAVLLLSLSLARARGAHRSTKGAQIAQK